MVPFIGMRLWCELGTTCALNTVFSVAHICMALAGTNGWRVQSYQIKIKFSVVVQECMQ